ncbi:ABC transporter permease [Rhodospirillum rubrum]|uniref:Amino acid ABC transporter, permease protein, 3-TM region, His/Glu/Gln/Arg/opine n=1 Tax=Rhodospirillum rubrum (strain ATCC 11170 / ATH 1.1.1 / DSM 467 / LMG 4362 / NCIMB 8255 / S1) TaxID=269796 RepID=Q2RS42_RHORT|nr:ABC transporter permease [Rhodospirillum rubrum]ABC23053.1 Amino acid ABC transporter, permease protein, 3-TM region, His/Glu/Gln/Arg/opine [Rhodospirillum rubrum ATCC 11170]AEO48782.1 amino acid ABC transporter permease [Rhodospirillum rubrum F11]MBK5954680.1 ABC transporter permease [Rhodospirillum rubrum]QXG79037.1 ABC transporter permease [Rhodospirillum rubrum]HAP99203.1 ABC transporter permease [Rhodospirillum rubrum]
MNLDLVATFLPKLLFEGLPVTLKLVTLAVAIGVFIAIPTALLRVHPSPLVRAFPYAFIFFFRGTPLLIQIALVYYGLSTLPWIRENEVLWPILREPFWCALIAFALNTGAYSAEILRGAIQAIPRGEVEAARAYGMRGLLIVRRIILPRAFQIGLPAYGNEIILILKGSALASSITLLDITGVARLLYARYYTPVEAFVTAGVIYLILVYLLTRGLRLIERRLSRHLLGPPETELAEDR